MALRPIFIVGIAGSAGGLQANMELFKNLSPKTGMAFVLIFHFRVDQLTFTADIISRYTRMHVVDVMQGMRVEANTVYVIKPNSDLFIEGDNFVLKSPRSMKKHRHIQGDLFFKSLARSRGTEAIAVVVSGGDGDGTEGCCEIKRQGGRTYAQDWSALIDSMPKNAIDSGCIDFIMPPSEIAKDIEKLTMFANEQSQHGQQAMDKDAIS